MSERVRLAMGLSLRPDDEPVHLTAGLDASNVAEKYYEPPLMQVIPSACDKCPDNIYEVSNQCRGCMAHPCAEVCPKGAISMVKGQSYIDMEKMYPVWKMQGHLSLRCHCKESSSVFGGLRYQGHWNG